MIGSNPLDKCPTCGGKLDSFKHQATCVGPLVEQMDNDNVKMRAVYLDEKTRLQAKLDAALLQIDELKSKFSEADFEFHKQHDQAQQWFKKWEESNRLIDDALVTLTMGAHHPKDPKRIDRAIEILLKAPEKREHGCPKCDHMSKRDWCDSFNRCR